MLLTGWPSIMCCATIYTALSAECAGRTARKEWDPAAADAVPSSEQVRFTARVDDGQRAPRGSIAGRPTVRATPECSARNAEERRAQFSTRKTGCT